MLPGAMAGKGKSVRQCDQYASHLEEITGTMPSDAVAISADLSDMPGGHAEP